MFNSYFLPSFNRHLAGKFKLHAFKVEQKCPSGDFNSPGFSDCMADKLMVLRKAVNDNLGKPFVYADCDIQFFGDISGDIDLDGIDAQFQEDVEMPCAGFFFAKSTPAFSNFLNQVHKHNHLAPNDQLLFNQFKDLIKWTTLPRNKYFTVGHYNGGKVWDGEWIDVPKECIMHHANYTIGVRNKIKMMHEVKNRLA